MIVFLAALAGGILGGATVVLGIRFFLPLSSDEGTILTPDEEEAMAMVAASEDDRPEVEDEKVRKRRENRGFFA
jgi:hypothetical protein